MVRKRLLNVDGLVGALFEVVGRGAASAMQFLNISEAILRTWDFHFQVRLFRSSLHFLSCSASWTSWILSGQEMELVFFLGSYPNKQNVVTLKTYIQTNKKSLINLLVILDAV